MTKHLRTYSPTTDEVRLVPLEEVILELKVDLQVAQHTIDQLRTAITELSYGRFPVTEEDRAKIRAKMKTHIEKHLVEVNANDD